MVTVITATFLRFAKSEQFAGVLLIGCTALSLGLANSPMAGAWAALWQVELGPLTAGHWVNDALMAVFFLLIGLELERELYAGELSDWRRASLPAFAAVGGMVAPALLHYSLNAGTITQPGFGIPMATDIAFALGILALLGARVPTALKVFVVAFAVIDDLGAIVLIAAVYTDTIALTWLAGAIGAWVALLLLNRPLRVMSLVPYLVGGVAIWVCLLKAGVHASVAGVVLAFAIPFSPRDPGTNSPSARLERALHTPVAWIVLPLFALANTGVTIDTAALATLASANSLGIVLGLVAGKPIGVGLACLVAVKLGASTLPDGVRWSHIVGAGMLGGIGFTMSIFITNLAFAEGALVNASKLAILAASLLAATLGAAWLRWRSGAVS
jgi:NhaA family Na+:H+ antiporter